MNLSLQEKIRRYLGRLKFNPTPCFTRCVNTTEEGKNNQIITCDYDGKNYIFIVQRVCDNHFTRAKAYTIRQALRLTIDAQQNYLWKLLQKQIDQIVKLQEKNKIIRQNITDMQAFEAEFEKTRFSEDEI